MQGSSHKGPGAYRIKAGGTFAAQWVIAAARACEPALTHLSSVRPDELTASKAPAWEYARLPEKVEDCREGKEGGNLN